MAKNTFTTIGILTVLLLALSMVSATSSIYLDISNLSFDSSVPEDEVSTTFTFDIEYTKDGDEAAVINFSDSSISIGSISISAVTLNGTANESKQVTGTISGFSGLGGTVLSIIVDASVEGASYKDNETNFTVSITDVVVATPSIPEDFNITVDPAYDDFLDIEDIEFDVIKGVGDEDDGFYPLDEIELTFTVDTKKDIKDIEILLCLYDEDEGECIFDEDDFDIDENDFDLDDEDIDVTATFTLDDPSDYDTSDYVLYIGVIGEIDDGAYEGNETFSYETEDFEIINDDNFVIISDIELSQDPALCDSNVQIVARVWNLDSSDLDDDEIFVNVYNKALGINKNFEFDRGIDSKEYEEIQFSFTVPADTEEKGYWLDFAAYDDDNMADKDIFENKDDDEAKYTYYLQVEGNCGAEPTVSASLDSEAKVGKELVITASVTNNGADGEYTISAASFASWAELVSVEPSEVSIDAGDTQEVTIILKPTKAGEHTFKIISEVEGDSSDQSISVTIEESSNPFVNMSNTMMYIIVGIIAVLILIVLTLIVKASKRPSKKAQF